MHTQQPLGILSPNLDVKTLTPPTIVTDPNLHKNKWLHALLWLVIIAIIVYILLILTKPTFVRKQTTGPDGVTVSTTEVDQTKTIVTSIIVAVIIVLILYALKVIH